MTRRLTIVAHWDPLNEVAAHVLRQLDQLASVSDDLVLVTTNTDLPQADRDAVSARAELVVRENVGQDFGSWHHVLRDRWHPGSHDEVFLTNDTYIGYLKPIAEVFDEMADEPVEFWGSHESGQLERHIQSFFLVFREPVLRSQAWARFWRRFEPAATRFEAIVQQEVGISSTLLGAGFEAAGYLRPTEAEWDLSRRRLARAHRLLAAGQREGRSKIHPVNTGSDPSNPATGMADLALDRARVPLVKVDVLRYDAYACGSYHLLGLCEERYPDLFDGVRNHLERTAWFYSTREHSTEGPATLTPQEQQTIGYHTPTGV